MECVCCYVIIIVAALYLLFDINYFIRTLFVVLWRKIVPKKKKNLSEEISTYGFCITNDVDIFLTHMNNARFLRELDFSRIDFYQRTGLYKVVFTKSTTILQGAVTVRYRKPLPIFTFYRITTRLVYWDEKAIYFEHKFITVSDNFIRAIILNKQHLIGHKISITEVLKSVNPDIQLQEPREDLKHWLNYINESSRMLKNV